MGSAGAPQQGKASLLYDPKIRGFVYQAVLLGLVAFLLYSAANNAIENLRAQKIAGARVLGQPFGL